VPLARLVVILIIGIFTLMPAYGQEMFLSVCNKQIPHSLEVNHDIQWLKFLFKTNDCQEVAKELSKLTSYSEFMFSAYLNGEDTRYSWIGDFPYLKGITGKYGLDWITTTKLDFYPDEFNIFKHPEFYNEFENLKVLDVTQYFNFLTLNACKFFENLPNVKVAIMNYGQLAYIDKHCKDIRLPLIILESANGKLKPLYPEKIIGFKIFNGSLGNLKKFRNLRYLGISNSTIDNDIGYLAQNVNLTHLSLNMRIEGVKNMTELGQLKNLESLTITCIQNITYSGYNSEIETCPTPYLRDISFLSELPWLKRLNLSANNLSDVGALKKLKRLEYLNLSHNNISEMPDLSELKNLKEIDLSENPMSTK
jgi:hypothetical protein